MVRTSTAGASDGHVFMVFIEYRATSACMFKDRFSLEYQCEAWSKKYFMIVSTISASISQNATNRSHAEIFPNTVLVLNLS